MRIVLDTNVFLVSLSPYSAFAPIFDALLAAQFTLLLSNEVITEYDRHFKVLLQVPFPIVKTLNAEEFIEILAIS